MILSKAYIRGAGNVYKHLILRKIVTIVSAGIPKKQGETFYCLTSDWILPKILIVSNVVLLYVGAMTGSGRESKRRKQCKKT